MSLGKIRGRGSLYAAMAGEALWLGKPPSMLREDFSSAALGVTHTLLSH